MMTFLFFIASVSLLALSMCCQRHSKNIYCELASHFAPQYMIASAVLLVLMLLISAFHISSFLLFIVSIALNAQLVLPWLKKPNPFESDSDSALKVLQLNLYKFNYKHEKTYALVEDEDPDIIVLAELTPRWLESLKALEEKYPHHINEKKEGSWGMAVYSKLPLDNIAVENLIKQDLPTIFFSITHNRQAINFISIHPPTPMSRSFLTARNQHFKALVKKIDALQDQPLVLLGDMNITMYNPFFRKFMARTKLSNARKNRGIFPSWPAHFPWILSIPIDHVLHNKHVSIHDFKTGPYAASDHLPTITQLSAKVLD